jgi:hypothetical protein
VIAPAVGLDHEAKAGPEEVDLEAVDHLLRERSGKTGLRGDRAEENFELGIGEPKGLAVEQDAERANPGLARARVECHA